MGGPENGWVKLLLWDEDVLGRPPAPPGAALAVSDVAAVYCARPVGASAGHWLRATMVSTVDGAAIDASGVSDGINTGADHMVFEAMRTQCDAVLVGAGTVRIENYTRLSVPEEYRAVRLEGGRTEPPVLVVLTNSGNVPEKVIRPVSGAGGLLVVAGSGASPRALGTLQEAIGQDAVVTVAHGQDTVAAAVLAAAERGLTTIQCEGGPSLLSSVWRAGVLDEVCLTISPLLVGGAGLRIVNGPDGRTQLRPVALLEEDGSLIGRWLLV